MPVAQTVGPITILQNAVVIAANGASLDVRSGTTLMVEISGTYTNVTANFEASIDGGTTWWAVALATLNSTTLVRTLTAATNGLYRLEDCGGLTHFRARTTIGAATGTMTVKAIVGQS